MADEATPRAWLEDEGFLKGNLRRAIYIDSFRRCPMAQACLKGELGISMKAAPGSAAGALVAVAATAGLAAAS